MQGYHDSPEQVSVLRHVVEEAEVGRGEVAGEEAVDQLGVGLQRPGPRLAVVVQRLEIVKRARYGVQQFAQKCRTRPFAS